MELGGFAFVWRQSELDFGSLRRGQCGEPEKARTILFRVVLIAVHCLLSVHRKGYLREVFQTRRGKIEIRTSNMWWSF